MPLKQPKWLGVQPWRVARSFAVSVRRASHGKQIWSLDTPRATCLPHPASVFPGVKWDSCLNPGCLPGPVYPGHTNVSAQGGVGIRAGENRQDWHP